MASDLRLREEFQQPGQQLFQLFELLPGERVGGMSFRIQSAFVAYTDGTAVERTAMSPHFEQPAMPADSSVTAYVEVITDSAEPTGTMVTQELLHGIVAVTTGSGTVQDDVTHRICGIHHQPVLHPGEEFTLTEHFLPAHSHRECFLYHGSMPSTMVEQLVTPSAVSAAMAA